VKEQSSRTKSPISHVKGVERKLAKQYVPVRKERQELVIKKEPIKIKKDNRENLQVFFLIFFVRKLSKDKSKSSTRVSV